MKIIDFELRDAFIPLDDLLKATGVAPSGGAAKSIIADGKVRLDGEVEWQKAKKVYAGQLVETAAVRIRMHAPTRPAPFM